MAEVQDVQKSFPEVKTSTEYAPPNRYRFKSLRCCPSYTGSDPVISASAAFLEIRRYFCCPRSLCELVVFPNYDSSVCTVIFSSLSWTVEGQRLTDCHLPL